MTKKSRDRRKANRRKYYSFDAGIDPQYSKCSCSYIGKDMVPLPHDFVYQIYVGIHESADFSKLKSKEK